VKEERSAGERARSFMVFLHLNGNVLLPWRIQKFGMTSAAVAAGFAFFSGTKIYYPALF
jgi:hypothetical protein